MILRLLFALIALIGISPLAVAQDYPSRSITVVLPFPPGGPLDFLIRTIQRNMETALGQTIVIESRPGASGNVGSAYVAKAAPDGYTLLTMATNIGVFPHVFPHLPYDPIKDLAVVGVVAETPNVCVVNTASKYQSFADIIKEAKANPGKVVYGSTGTGSPSHLIPELMAKLNKVSFTHVPYKGLAPAITDLLGNFVAYVCAGGLAGVLPLIQEGKLRAIAVTTEKRFPMLPDVPTVKELGFGDIDEGLHYILLAPAMTPKPIMERLSATVAAALAEPSVKEAYGKLGFEVSTKPPAQVSAEIQEQYVFWGPIIKDLNLKLDE
jgi:tripartite-type tricarboxylate transporter receptor subunit TctC